MELFDAFFIALWELTAAMAPYILFGLFFAGILHEWVPTDFVTKHLGKENISSVAKATLFGIPLPVCSCGVIPLAAALQKEGASRGAVLAFLIATPITGIDSILATFGMFGWAFTLYRIASSLVIAFLAGIASNLYATKPLADQTFQAPPSTPSPIFTPAANPSGSLVFNPSPNSANSTCDCETGCCETAPPSKGFDVSAAMRYGFVTLLGDIAKPLLWGLLIGAAITVAMPEDMGSWLAHASWLGYLIVIAIAVPMYICATASLPIAASLVLSGVSLGAAFVFLSAGPATNTVTIGVVKKMLGSRALAIYLATIVVGSLLFGIAIDGLFDAMQIDPKAVVHIDETPSLIAALSSVALWVLIVRHIAGGYRKKNENMACESGCCG